MKKEDIKKMKVKRGRVPMFLKEYANKNKMNPTNSERLFENILKQNKIKYDYQYPISVIFEGVTYNYIVDFKVKKNIIEIDGGYHYTEEQRKKDSMRYKLLTRLGYNVIRVPNRAISTVEIQHIIERISNIYGKEGKKICKGNRQSK